MNSKGRKTIMICMVVLCAILLGTAVALFVNVLPKKQTQTVETLQTNSVFQTQQTVVEPEREQAFEGEIPEAVTEAQQMPEETEPAVETTHTQLALDTLGKMSTQEKIWQLFFARPEQITGVEAATVAGDMTRTALETKKVGGLIYSARNIEDPEQVTKLLQGTQEFSEIPLFMGIDEEGGSVCRISNVEAMNLAPVEAASAYGAKADVETLSADYLLLAQFMKQLGFNLNFAPVCDVPDNDQSTIFTRAFSTDPAVCSDFVKAAVSAYHEGGIGACLKHFPGYGAAAQDDHFGTVVIGSTPEELRQQDLLPFLAGIEAGADFVMISHLTCSEISTEPSDLSKEIVTELLRSELGFSGVIITDAQDMGSITGLYSPADAAVKALQAGCDMILTPAGLQEAYDGVLAAVQNGQISEQRIDESVLRILDAKVSMGILTE